MLRRKYNIRTIKTYLYCVKQFLKQNHKDVRKYSKKDIKEYLYNLQEKRLSVSTINVNLQALKFMMENVLHKPGYIRIKFSKNENRKRFPEALTQEEIKKLFSVIENKKHLLMVKLMYSAGLRVSELLNLKAEDFDFENGVGLVKKGKGNKDRYFIIANSLKEELKEYIKNKNGLVFEGAKGKLSVRTIQEILKKASKKAKIKHVHLHMLRHSFATHLLENGTDLISVQSLLGHNSAETTMIYARMVNPKITSVKSPLDG